MPVGQCCRKLSEIPLSKVLDLQNGSSEFPVDYEAVYHKLENNTVGNTGGG